MESVDFATETKRTERNKFVMSESTKVTKARKHDHSWASAEIFPRGNVHILFIIFILLTITVPSKIMLHWANICFSEHDILGLSKWSFQWITNFVKYIINIQFYQNTNKIHISFKQPIVFGAVSIAFECCNCARMRFHCAVGQVVLSICVP